MYLFFLQIVMIFQTWVLAFNRSRWGFYKGEKQSHDQLIYNKQIKL